MIVTVGLQQLAYMQALLNVIISMITLSVNLINQKVNPDGQVQLLGERVFFSSTHLKKNDLLWNLVTCHG